MRKILSLLLCALAIPLIASSQPISESKVDDVVARSMKAFNVPGMSVAIIKDGKVVLAKGYGVSNIRTGAKTDANTLFGIASVSKAFTAAALAILVDENKIAWDDKVVKHLPDFRMYNDYVTAEFTIRDLLTHRSGLGLGAGDLMIWPDGHDFTPKDIIGNIRYLKPVSGFRTKYDYDNLLYVIAGEIVAKASGMTWPEFVEQRFMAPLQMTRSAGSWKRLKDTANASVPHVPVNGKLQVVARYTNTIFDAAAGIYTSANDLSQWVIAQLDSGKIQNGNRLFSEKQHAEMWTPQTLLPVKNTAPYKTLFKAYGMGWQLADVNGNLQVSHTGGLEGMVAQLVMFPEHSLGIIVLTNQQSGAAFNAVSNTIKDAYLGISNPDHVDALSANLRQKEDNADSITDEVWKTVAKNAKEKRKSGVINIAGIYSDPWFGDVEITEKKGKYYFTSKRSPRLSGEVFWYKDSNFVVKWNERSFDADAHINFLPGDNPSGFTMKAISPLTDFSYDFHDLNFTRKP